MYSIKDEFTGWKLWEILWLLFSVLTVGIGSLFYKDNWMGIAGAVCGILASVLTGKGKLSAYVIGGVGRVFYAFVGFIYKRNFYNCNDSYNQALRTNLDFVDDCKCSFNRNVDNIIQNRKRKSCGITYVDNLFFKFPDHVCKVEKRIEI